MPISHNPDLEALARRLRLLQADLELDALATEYLAQSSEPGLELSEFVRWLSRNGKLNHAQSQEILAELDVEVTGLNILAQFYDHTQAADLKQGDPLGPLIDQPQGASGYFLLKQIGAGAMGSVHLAKDRLLRRTVAFKQLLQQSTDPLVSQRFLGEAQITSQLDHPHVIPIYGLEVQSDGQLAYTMKMIQGQSLKQWLAQVRSLYHQGKVPQEYRLPARLRLFLKLCDALAFAHSKHVIHRDLKPANIMLGRYGEVYVMDWGIARPFEPLAEGDSAQDLELDYRGLYQHEAGQIVGTPRYMSPEQAGGLNDRLDQRSDLFALGLILFEMVTLRQAIQAPDLSAVLQKALRAQLEPLESAYGEKIPAPLRSIIARATARRRAERYPDVAMLAADLRAYLLNQKVQAHQESALERLQRGLYQQRQRILPGLLLLVLCGFGLSLGIELLRQHQTAQAAIQRQQISQLLSSLSNHAQQVSGRFQLLEAQLQELSAAAEVAVLSPAKGPAEPVYLAENYQAGHHPPADWLPAGKRRISLEWPVIKLAPGLKPEPALLASLMPLRHTFYRIFSQSQGPEFMMLPRKQQQERLRSQTPTLLNAYVGLASGLHLSYPGKGGYQANYDPRLRPWYQAGLNAHEPLWSEPFADALGLGQVLPCVQAIYDPQRRLLGVAGIEISLEQVAQVWLPFRQRQDVRRVVLLNSQAQVIAAWPELTDSQELTQTLSQTLFKSLQSQQTGFIRQGDQQFWAWTRLAHQDWELLIEGSWDDLLQIKQP